MRKKHREYLIIPIHNIKTKDNSNVMISNNENVISSHQKIVLKLSMNNKNHKGDAYELITGIPFYFKSSLFDILYKGKLCDTIGIESDNLLINIHPKFVTIDEVKLFFDEIINSGEAVKYKELIGNVLLNKEKDLIKKRSIFYK